MNELQDKLQPFIDSVNLAIKQGNYYAALTVALTLPDICSKLAFPDKKSGERYSSWFDCYLSSDYKDRNSDKRLLNGDDIYALRCAFLHEGGTDITGQRARSELKKFYFNNPVEVGMLSIVITDFESEENFLPVDDFCLGIVRGVQRWINRYYRDEKVNKRAETLMKIS